CRPRGGLGRAGWARLFLGGLRLGLSRKPNVPTTYRADSFGAARAANARGELIRSCTVRSWRRRIRLCGRFPYRPTIGGACGMYRLAISIATIFGTRLATIFGTRPSSALEMSRGPPSAPGPWAPTHLRGWPAAEPTGERAARSPGPDQVRQEGRAADARG